MTVAGISRNSQPFEDHLANCEQCVAQPFTLCPVGRRALFAQTVYKVRRAGEGWFSVANGCVDWVSIEDALVWENEDAALIVVAALNDSGIGPECSVVEVTR